MTEKYNHLYNKVKWAIEYEVKCMRKLKKMKDIVEKIGIDFPECTWSKFWTDIECELPYSFEIINDVKKYMEKEFPNYEFYLEYNVIWESNNPNASYFLAYLPKDKKEDFYDLKIEFRFDTNTKGSTCVLNQIGVKEVPVWEMTCSQGTEEFTYSKEKK